MDFNITLVLCSIFVVSVAVNFGNDVPQETSGLSPLPGNDANLLQRLEFTEKLVQHLLGRVEYLEKREKDQQQENQNLRKQLGKADERNRFRRAENENPVAFFAAITNHVTHAGVNQTYVFDHAITNLGNAYNNHNGNFVAPVDGTYVFSVTLMSLYHVNAHAKFFKNGQPVSTLYVSGAEAGYDTTSQTIVLQLHKGDDISVHNIDVDVSMAGAHYSTFSGFLLQENYSSSVVVGRK
ncbi:cerebellin-1-like [Mercenaria mercenaria]|uniref:cerebellin-1-like n=1 Tax=Mercenaria mercenaria TaxID=6596 RepID=UPI00234F7B00|nr:cerebellin-1-like [Mercenaria mercenaria]